MEDSSEWTTLQVAQYLRVAPATVNYYVKCGKLKRIDSRATGRGRPVGIFDRYEVERLADEKNKTHAMQLTPTNYDTFVIISGPENYSEPSEGEPRRYWITVQKITGRIHSQHRALLPPENEEWITQVRRFLKPGWRILIDGKYGDSEDIGVVSIAVDVTSMVQYALNSKAQQPTPEESS